MELHFECNSETDKRKRGLRQGMGKEVWSTIPSQVLLPVSLDILHPERSPNPFCQGFLWRCHFAGIIGGQKSGKVLTTSLDKAMWGP
jgi:hypothetical protein